MMITKTKRTTVKHKIVEGVICDKCKKRIDEGDFVGMQECYHIRFSGGYGSVFGDGANIACDLCQECLKELIGEFCRYESEDQ